MKYDINKTAVVPCIIAENAIWNVIEGEEKYRGLQPDEINAMVAEIKPMLTIKAERLYNVSTHFRKAINRKGTDMRYQLEIFMEHWTKAILKKQKSIL